MRLNIIVGLLALAANTYAATPGAVSLRPVYRSALDIPIDSLTSEQRQAWMEQAEGIYYAPESQYRDEEMYIKVLDKILASTKLTDIEKERYRFQMKECTKNRAGEKVADFEFVRCAADGCAADPSGASKQGSVAGVSDTTMPGSFYEWLDNHKSQASNLKVKSSKFKVLLYFFNPDCHDCSRVSDILNSDSTIRRLAADSTLLILPVYPDDDLTGWEKVPADGKVVSGGMPAVRLASPKEREKFHLPAIPSLYLLDADGTVILKDATPERIISTFSAQ